MAATPPEEQVRPLTSPCSLKAVPTAPRSGSGVLLGQGAGPCLTPGGARDSHAERSGEKRSVSYELWGTTTHSGHLSGASAGLPQSEPCKNP